MPLHEILALAMFALFIASLFLGLPVAWTLGGLAVVFTVISVIAAGYFGADISLDWSYTSLVVDRLWDVMRNWVLVALPIFTFMGLMLDKSGLADRLMVNFARLFGKTRGGLAVTVAAIGILLAASTGIVGASVTLLALLGLPAMLKRRYDPGLATGTVAAAGTLGILIPPSIMLVVMGDRLSLPVGDLFLAALFPGFLLGFLYVAYILIVARIRPELAPVPEDAEPVTARIVWDVVKAVTPTMMLILAVLGSIFAGIATPTEAAGIGALGAMFLAWRNKALTRAVLRDVLQKTTLTTSYIMAIFLGATAFSLVMRGLGGDELIHRLLTSLPVGPQGLVVFILFVVFVLGFFLDWIEIVVVVMPLVMPTIRKMGFDPVWFTVLFAVVLQSSFLTPPVGFSLFFMKSVAPKEVTTAQIYRGIIPFVALIFFVTVLCFFWKELVLWLPQVAYGGLKGTPFKK